MAGAMTRRSALGTFGAVGAALATGTLSIGTPARAQAQGQSQALGLQESVQDGLKRVFGGWIVADKNRIPIIAKATLTPEAGQAFVGANVRLGETTDVRAIVEQSDGTLLTAKREVKVTVGGCGG